MKPRNSRAAALIRAGELVAFPTETVYGLGANALDPAAIEKIYAAKGRPPSSPLIVHVSSIEMARGLVREWPERAEKLARIFWPGPLTLVLPETAARSGSSDRRTGYGRYSHARQSDRAGVDSRSRRSDRRAQRQSVHANFRRPPRNTFAMALGDRVAMVLDGGRTTVGIESTVLSLAGPDAVLLRPGMVTQQEIEAVIGPVQVLAAEPAEGAIHRPDCTAGTTARRRR